MSELLKGKNSIFYIKYDNIWTPIGCEKASPMTENAEMLDTTTRDNAGWKTSIPTLQGYSFAIEAMAKRDDVEGVISYRKIRKLKRERTLIEWQRRTEVGYLIDFGKGHITNIGDSNDVAGEISFSLTIEGFGKPEENVIADNYYVYADDITYNFDYEHLPQEANAGGGR